MATPLILALGGTRSGKSRYGLAAARRLAGDGRAWFLATAWPGDPELDDRIARHRAERPAAWPTIEVGADLADALRRTEPAEPVLIDGLTLWLSTLLGDEPGADRPDPRRPGRRRPRGDRRAPGAGHRRQRRGRLGHRADARRRARLSGPRRDHPPAPRGARRRGRPDGGRPAGPAAMTDLRRPGSRGTGSGRRDGSWHSPPLLGTIGPLDAAAMAAAEAQLDRLTKPPGSLGRLESLVDPARRHHRSDRRAGRAAVDRRRGRRPRRGPSRACRPIRRT